MLLMLCLSTRRSLGSETPQQGVNQTLLPCRLPLEASLSITVGLALGLSHRNRLGTTQEAFRWAAQAGVQHQSLHLHKAVACFKFSVKTLHAKLG